MVLEEIIRSSVLSFDIRKFMQSLEEFKDYNDEMYQLIHHNIVGGSRAHAELIGPLCFKVGPEWE